MTDAIRYRGPDDGGEWCDESAGVVLGSRRLAIQDLSTLGHQPMSSSSKRYTIAYNGEIYNFEEIRLELQQKGVTFRGHSDTEVMLAAFECWGLRRSLEHFVGMFAFALWDSEEKVLTIARDRIGEKPLYYGWGNGVFLFASELKALRYCPGSILDVNRDAIALLMRYGYIPSPHSIFSSIYKLQPGSFLSLSLEALRSKPSSFSPHSNDGGSKISPLNYWSVNSIVESTELNPFKESEETAIEELHNLLSRAVKMQMVSDVPVGAFLSGGVDSSTIVALMQSHSNRPVNTFSIGFHEADFDEAPHARVIARHLGTLHQELYVTFQEAMNIIPKLPSLFDEPFADSSQMPTFFVSELARQKVTVSLSGDGGDELFGGYPRYLWGNTIWRWLRVCPRPLRQQFAKGLRILSPIQWDAIFNGMSGVLPNSFSFRNRGEKVHKLANLLQLGSYREVYQMLLTLWSDSTKIVRNSKEVRHLLTFEPDQPQTENRLAYSMWLDLVTYLPEDILVKVDRASMGVSLESRAPFLDHRVVEFATQLPTHFKIRNGQTKWILRQVLNRYVPAKLVERPKMGFSIPIEHWLRGPLREWAEELLQPSKLEQEGYFDTEIVRSAWGKHLSGRRSLQHSLWIILMFQAWLREFYSSTPLNVVSINRNARLAG